MPVFSFKAVDLDLAAVSGTVVADTAWEARDQLRGRGLTIEQVTPVAAPRNSRNPRKALTRWTFPLRATRRYDAQAVMFIRELSTLLGAGLPMLDALDTVTKQCKGGFEQQVLVLRDRIASGASLAEAMAEQPHVFDELAVRMTEVGESAGNLDEVLTQLAEFKLRMRELKNRVASALMYPAIVGVVGVGVAIFLMTFVTPNLLDTLTDAGKELPFITRLVKTCSDLLVTKWWLLLGVVSLAVVGTGALLRTERGRWRVHRALIQLPGVGEMVRKQAVVRIAMIVSTLMRSGIVFERAIHIAGRSTRNLVLRKALEDCEEAVRAGRDIDRALEATGAFPPTVVQVFAVGQQSGRLEEMLDRLARDYDQQVSTLASRLTAVLEPILILFLAIVVGAIAFATILPILEAGHVL